MKEKFNSKVLDIIILVLLTGAVVFALVVGNRYKKHDNVRDDTLVRVDASLATQPLMDAYVEGLKDYNLKKDYTNTDPAYTKLINGETDLIIVTEPSSDELKRASDAGVELEVTPVVNEGFVFFTNDIAMILRRAPPKEKRKLKPKPVLIRATINTLIIDIIKALLKLYLYKTKSIITLANPNFNPGIISPKKVK